MKNTKKLKLSVLAVLLLLVGCNDDVTVTNTNELVQSTFFENLAQLESSATACYAQLQNTGLYQRFGYILPDTFSDEMVTGTDPNFLTSYNYNLTPSSEQTSRYWNNCYNGIGACNFVIGSEDLIRSRTESANFSEADANDALGQAYFLRGLYYFLLVKRYAGVPLIIDIQSIPEGLPRSTEDQVYERIIEDFRLASELLYAKGATETGRATKGAAFGMLGKVNLFREQYTEAQTALAQVNEYNLLPLEEYNNNFNESGEFNNESMFEVAFSGENVEAELWEQTGIGVAEATFHAQEYSGWGNANPSQKIIDEFEDDDPRFKSAILLDGDPYGPDNSFTHTLRAATWYKFSQLYENETVTELGETNVRFLRYADVVLMQAEVELELGNNSLAIDFLNQIRERVELPLYGTPEMDARGYPVTSKDEIFNAIVHERMVELCAEQHRFDDLIRWDMDALELATDDNGVNRGYNPDVHRLMPIPQTEIDSNPMISPSDQNPGY